MENLSDTPPRPPLNIAQLHQKLERGEKLVMLTANDYTQACLADSAGVDMLLVGYALGQLSFGHSNERRTAMEEVMQASRAVARAAKRALIIGNMPFASYRVNHEQAVENALQLLGSGGCRAVKLEVARDQASLVQELTKRGLPVLAHIGLRPQTAGLWDGFDPRGCDEDEAWELVETAQAMEEAGAFALLVQGVTSEVARLITEKVDIPTIGMGAGPSCDGQLLLFHDVLGLREDIPTYAKVFANAGQLMRQGIAEYSAAVRSGAFPTEEHSTAMSEDEAKRLF